MWLRLAGLAGCAVFNTPAPSTVIRNYGGPYPIMTTSLFTDHEGTYQIEGYMNYNGAIKDWKFHIQGGEHLQAEINLDEDRIRNDESISFEAEASGESGTSATRGISGTRLLLRAARQLATSSLSLEITLSADCDRQKGNKATANKKVYVQDEYNVDIIVLEEGTNSIISGATVRVNQEDKTTDATEG
jgi:hypothetical protein